MTLEYGKDLILYIKFETMNMELRTDALRSSILIEDILSGYLSHLFNIKKDTSLTLGIKGSSLSLKTKVDLLRDLNRISSDEQKYFLLFMEIRNKIVHNLEMDTMFKALESLGSGKIATIIKIDNNVYELYQKCRDEAEIEDVLVLAFKSLWLKLSNIVSLAIEKLVKELNDQAELKKSEIMHDLYKDFFKALQSAIDKFSKGFDETFGAEDEGEVYEIGIAKRLIDALFVKELGTMFPEVCEQLKHRKIEELYPKTDENE